MKPYSNIVYLSAYNKVVYSIFLSTLLAFDLRRRIIAELLYGIKEYFQGRNEKGKINNKSSDEIYLS